MNHYPFDKDLANESDVLNYYIDAIRYRNIHKDESEEIALHVFRRSNPNGMLSFRTSKELENLRYEFRALEAIGMPENDEKDPAEYDDEVWMRLLGLVQKAKEKGIV